MIKTLCVCGVCGVCGVVCVVCVGVWCECMCTMEGRTREWEVRVSYLQ